MREILRVAGVILRNDLRLSWRRLRAARMGAFLQWGVVAVLFLLAQAVALLVVYRMRREPMGEAYGLVGMLYFCPFMLSAAVAAATEALHQRGDFDLLVSSPIPPRSIVLARFAAIVLSTALSGALFAPPAINAWIVWGGLSHIFGYVTYLGTATVVATAGTGLVFVLTRWIGAQRAQVWSQILSIGTMTITFMGPQLANHLGSKELQARILTGLAESPLVEALTQASRSEPAALAGVVVVTLLCAVVLVWRLDRVFVHGVQTATERAGGRRRTAEETRVRGGGLVQATMRKELRLLLRDPLLLTRAGQQAVGVVPGLAMTFNPKMANMGIAFVAVWMTAILTGSFATIAAAGEECWDLIRMSPARDFHVRLGKALASGLLPVAVAVIAFGALVIRGYPGYGVAVLATALVLGAVAAWLPVARVKPVPRAELFSGRRAFDTSVWQWWMTGLLLASLVGFTLWSLGILPWLGGLILLVVNGLGLAMIVMVPVRQVELD